MIRKACRDERTEKAIEGRGFESRTLKSFECKSIVRLTLRLLLWFSVHACVFIDTPEFFQDPNELFHCFLSDTENTWITSTTQTEEIISTELLLCGPH